MCADLASYLSEDRWYQKRVPDGPAAIGYFSPEFGITAVLPQYSGGLGILAGDHLKAASDLGVPIVGVGLLYKHGYFKQSLSREGWQQETYPVLDPDGLPISALLEANGAPATISIDLPGGPPLVARIWVASVGRVSLLMLDTDVEGNPDHYVDVTDRLYGGNSEHRLRQELLLGVGGVRALRAHSRITGAPTPEVFHTNEGHAGFLGLERIRELTVAEGGPKLDFDTALEMGRASTVFTTHTPVPAGIDRFPRSLMEQYFSQGGRDPRRADRPDPGARHRGLRGRRLVGLQHGGDGLPARPARQRRLGPARRGQPGDVQRPVAGLRRGRGADRLDHQRRARALVGRAGGVRPRRRARAPTRTATTPRPSGPRSTRCPARTSGRSSASCASGSSSTRASGCSSRGSSAAWRRPSWAGSTPRSSPDVLTIGFARRAASYKRLTLMMRDPARLKALLLHPERPIQLVIAGKAHPADDGGKKLIQDIVKLSEDPEIRHRIVFLPNYDIAMAQPLYPGCDVWLNNPLRPYEACGTSGMKAALNGGLNLSVLDGWWDEWYDGENGWAIPTADGVEDIDTRDDIEADALYDLIENDVTPKFYDHDHEGVPSRWLEMVRHTLKSLGPKVLATRMVRDYVRTLYAPAAVNSRELNADYSGAAELAAWKKKVRAAWPNVKVEHVESSGVGDAPEVGDTLSVRSFVCLGDLAPDDVHVQVVHGKIDSDDKLVDTTIEDLALAESYDGGRFRFDGDVVSTGRSAPVRRASATRSGLSRATALGHRLDALRRQPGTSCAGLRSPTRPCFTGGSMVGRVTPPRLTGGSGLAEDHDRLAAQR